MCGVFLPIAYLLGVALVVLAGFMRILTPDFVRRFEGRMLNIHPSLLPKYPGLHTHARAIEARLEPGVPEPHPEATLEAVEGTMDGEL